MKMNMLEIGGNNIFDEISLNMKRARQVPVSHIDGEEKKENETYKVKYIGETGRSGYERAL